MTRVLITGCSTGIGRAAAVELTERGHDVVATARRPEALEDLDVALRLPLDVDDPASIEAALREAGQLDVLVNNAGFEVAGPIERVPLDEIRRMFETNYFGTVRLVQAVVPGMRERGSGVIVNLSSVAGRVVGPFNSFYAGTKFAVEALSEGLHLELGHFGIRVVVIEPGFIGTAFQGNVRRYGEDEPPYDELRDQWDEASEKLGAGDRPGPEIVSMAIADAIEDPGTPLRVPVGGDAEMVLAVRADNDDETFEKTMRDALGLEW